MYCDNCGREMPDEMRYCEYCGALQERLPFTRESVTNDLQSEQPLSVQDAAQRKYKKTKKIWIIAVSIFVVVVAVVSYFVLFPNYVGQMMAALREGNKAKAVDIYREHVIGHEKRELKAQSRYRSWLTSLRDDFEQELITHEEAESRLSIARLISLDTTAFQTVEDYIENLQQARETMEAAARSYKQGNFLGAMTGYTAVLNAGQFFHDEAAAGLESSAAGYRTDVIDAVEQQTEEGNYAQALMLLQEGLANLPKDELLTKAGETLQSVGCQAIASDFRRAFEEGDYEQARSCLSEGLELFSDDELLQKCQEELNAVRDYNVYTPWEIITIFDGRLTESDGTLLGDVKLHRPIFQSDYEHAKKFNAEFEALTFNPQLGKLTKPTNAETVKEFFSEEVDYGYFYSSEEWQLSYRNGPIVSFTGLSDVMRSGAVRPSCESYARTFNLETGEVLELMDILLIHPGQQVETIYKEIVEHLVTEGDDYLLDDPFAVEEIKDQCGDDIVFWLEEDGVHLYFYLGWAMGDIELLIPFTRTDFVQPFLIG